MKRDGYLKLENMFMIICNDSTSSSKRYIMRISADRQFILPQILFYLVCGKEVDTQKKMPKIILGKYNEAGLVFF